MNRRDLLRGSAAAAGGLALARCGMGANATQLNPLLDETRLGTAPFVLTAHEKTFAPTGKSMLPMWMYNNRVFPVLHARVGQEVNVRLDNRLPEHTSIHWHGLRIPNAMDGVPYLTQPPVQPGQSFTYRFAPPETGTYFFHPHCDTSAQLGRGLAGVLIVDGDENEPFDDDVVCVIKDWRDNGSGKFLPFVTDEGAARAGTFGTLRTVNGVFAPFIPTSAGADIRLRLINVDSTRICEIGIAGADAHVLAIDGNPIAPFKLSTWRLGPAMRIDLALRTPAKAPVRIVDYFAAELVTLATLVPLSAPKRNGPFQPKALKPRQPPEPDLARATKHEIALGASASATNYPNPPPIVLPDGRSIDLADSLCLSQSTLWAIDGKSWPDHDHRHLPPPLVTFKHGEHVMIEWFNTTPRAHPMHIHGHTMKFLAGNKLKRPTHWTDTVLVMPNERVQVAFVADNPGNWMMHCHIIEHQDTGMMAWFRVA